MELRHLRYFIAVAEELNFTRAAEKLRLSQPSLTRQVHNLEEELGVLLFNRTKNHVSLTEEGTSFFTDAKSLIAASLKSVKAVQNFVPEKSDRLNLGYLAKFDFDSLPATLETFYKAHPEMSVNLFDMCPAEQLRALDSRKIDLGFVGLRPPDADATKPDLLWECVAHHAGVVVLPSDHPLAKKTTIALHDLKRSYFVAMSEETHPGSRMWLTSLCREAASFTPRILQDVALESGIMTFVAAGLGVTLARESIKRWPHPGVVFRPVSPPFKVDHWIAWRRENTSPAFLEYIEIVKREAPAWH